ncbi:hypothetical protein AOLI_G00135310 [Acnodon oligacanthus]
MIPVQRVQAQAQVWPGEPPPLLWMLPGLCPLASAAPPPPLLVASRAPPLLRAVSRWQLSSNSCEPFLPLVRAAEPVVTPFPLASVQWELPSRPPMLSFQPSAGVDLVPVFPPLYRTLLPPHYGKAWLEKRVPDYKSGSGDHLDQPGGSGNFPAAGKASADDKPSGNEHIQADCRLQEFPHSSFDAQACFRLSCGYKTSAEQQTDGPGSSGLDGHGVRRDAGAVCIFSSSAAPALSLAHQNPHSHNTYPR